MILAGTEFNAVIGGEPMHIVIVETCYSVSAGVEPLELDVKMLLFPLREMPTAEVEQIRRITAGKDA